MALWFLNKVVWFVLATLLEGILSPSKMAAKTTFCLYLVKCLIVALRHAVNITTSSFQHFPWSLSAKFVFRKRQFITLKITFWSSDQLRTYSFYENGAGLKTQITIILFKIWPTNRFSKAKSYNFHFHVNKVTWPLSVNGLLLSLLLCSHHAFKIHLLWLLFKKNMIKENKVRDISNLM